MLRLKRESIREVHATCLQHSVIVVSCDPEDDIDYLSDTAARLLLFMREKEL